MIKGVAQLPPAHLLVWDRASRTTALERYWEMPVHSGDQNTSWRDLVGEFEHLLESSVRARLISDVPL
jgi:asparagine synthetase B (glutamine-hydrolysing)